MRMPRLLLLAGALEPGAARPSACPSPLSPPPSLVFHASSSSSFWLPTLLSISVVTDLAYCHSYMSRMRLGRQDVMPPCCTSFTYSSLPYLNCRQGTSKEATLVAMGSQVHIS